MSKSPQSTVRFQVLLSLRWPLAGVVGLLFALVRLAEIFLFSHPDPLPLWPAFDALFWGVLASLAIWVVLSWAARQEQRRRSAELLMLDELRKSNAKLELLYELNQRIASSATLDDVLDYAISLPDRLLGAKATALVLYDQQGTPLIMRSQAISEEDLHQARSCFGLLPIPSDLTRPHLLLRTADEKTQQQAAVIIPLAEGGAHPIGWIETYLTNPGHLQPANELKRLTGETEALLVTIAGELAEAIQGSRRRAREIANVAILEQSIMAERTRIAHDLHDGVAQSLAFMRMRVDLWSDWIEHDPERLRQEFRELKVNLREQIEELRRAIFALRPIELSQLGFVGALRRFVHEFADQQGWELDLELSDLPQDLPYPLELTAFRAVQEGLNNAAKHAKASGVAVRLREIDNGLQIIVRDNGVGFYPGEQADDMGNHLGLRQMRERAAALDGRVTIMARPGAGTELRVWLPLAYAREDKAMQLLND